MKHTEHIRTLAPWWFESLWNGDVRCAFMLDVMGDELHAGDDIVMHDKYSRRRLLGYNITHIFNGNDFADSNMMCVSFGRVMKLLDREDSL